MRDQRPPFTRFTVWKLNTAIYVSVLENDYGDRFETNQCACILQACYNATRYGTRPYRFAGLFKLWHGEIVEVDAIAEQFACPVDRDDHWAWGHHGFTHTAGSRVLLNEHLPRSA